MKMAAVKKIMERGANFDWMPLPSLPYDKGVISTSEWTKEWGGIYFLLSRDKSILYIGKAKKFKTRLMAHLNRSGWSRYMYDRGDEIQFCYLMAVDKNRVGEIEQLLIQLIQPPCNKHWCRKL